MERRKLSIQLEGTQLELIEGDITELEVDAVVNAANEDLQLGSGVAGAIREKGEGDEDRKLASAIRSSLALADRHGLKSIALPAISTGTFGFPVDRCARILLTEVYRYLQGGTKIERVAVSLWGDDNFEIFKRELRRGFR